MTKREFPFLEFGALFVAENADAAHVAGNAGDARAQRLQSTEARDGASRIQQALSNS